MQMKYVPSVEKKRIPISDIKSGVWYEVVNPGVGVKSRKFVCFDGKHVISLYDDGDVTASPLKCFFNSGIELVVANGSIVLSN